MLQRVKHPTLRMNGLPCIRNRQRNVELNYIVHFSRLRTKNGESVFRIPIEPLNATVHHPDFRGQDIPELLLRNRIASTHWVSPEERTLILTWYTSCDCQKSLRTGFDVIPSGVITIIVTCPESPFSPKDVYRGFRTGSTGSADLLENT